MSDEKKTGEKVEPRGLGEHARGLTAEYAHEQGWGRDEDQRTKLPEGKGDTDGGTDYEYGARDFGDEPVNTARFKDAELKPTEEGVMAEAHATEEHESGKKQGDKLDDLVPVAGHEESEKSGDSEERKPAPMPIK